MSYLKLGLTLSVALVATIFSVSSLAYVAGEPVISYVSGSGPHPLGTREVEIVVATDIDAKCRGNATDSGEYQDWRKYLTTTDNRVHRIRTPLKSDDNIHRYIRCRSINEQVSNTESFAFPITFANSDTVATPTNFAVDRSVSEDGHFTLSWDAVQGAPYLILKEQHNDGLWNDVAVTDNSISIDLHRPTEGNYLYKVAACSDSGLTDCSAFSSTIAVWVGQVQTGEAPVISYVSGSGPHPYGIDEVEIVISTNINAVCRGNIQDSGHYDDWNKTLNTTDNRLHRITTPVSGAGDTQRYLRCQATDTQAVNTESFVFEITISSPSNLAKPANFKVDNPINSGNYNLSWKPVDGAVTYLLKESSDGENWSIRLLDAAQTDIDMSKNEDGEYQYYVFACEDVLGLECGPCSDHITVTVTGSSGNNLAPTITSTPIVAGSENVSYQYDVEATDPDVGDVVSFSLTNPPAGMEIITESGLISWIPTTAQIGTHAITVVATDMAGLTDSQTFNLVISDVNEAPLITSIAITTATENSTYSYDVEATDGDAGDSITFSLTTQPEGMTIVPETGVIEWTPSPTQVQNTNVTVVATDLAGATNEQSFVISVIDVNNAPEIRSVPITAGKELEAYSYQIDAVDADSDALTYELTQQPAGMTISETGLIEWTPAYGDRGEHNVSVVVTDLANATVSQDFVIDVELLPNNVPTADAAAVTGNEDSIIAVTLSGSDSDGDALTYTVVSQPTNGVLTGTAPNLSYTPNTDFNGSDSFTFTVNDGLDTSTAATVNLTVLNVNDAPVANTQSVTLGEDTNINLVLTASDIDGDALTYQVVSQPSNGSLTGTAPNLNYTPNENYFGNDSFSFSVNDGTVNSTEASVSIVINSVNDAPRITSFPITIATLGLDYFYQLVVVETEGDSLNFELVNSPDGMSISPITGLISWTPTESDIGDHLVTVRVSDSHSASDTQSFTLEVSGKPNKKPAITSTPINTATVNEAYLYSIIATDPDSDPLTYSLVNGPAGMTVSLITGQVHWLPAAEQTGQHSVSVSVEDGYGGKTSQTYLIDVELGSNTAPQITSIANLSAEEGQLYSYQVEAIDSENDPIEFALIQSPQGMVISRETGLISWVPSDVAGQTYSVQIRVFDSKLAFDDQEFTLTPSASTNNSAPEINSTAPLSVDEDSLFSYQVTASDADGDELSFVLNNAPQGATINQNSGNIAWHVGGNLTQGLTDLNPQCLMKGDPIVHAQSISIEPELIWTSNVQSLNRPTVSPLFDTNNDGKVTEDDQPYLILNQSSGYIDTVNSWIRVYDPRTWEVVWESASELRATTATAVADLDGDGFPEIVGHGSAEAPGIHAYDRFGTKIWTSTDFPAILGYNYGTINIADIDADGTAEIIASNYVLDHLGNVEWIAASVPWHGAENYAVDLDSDGLLEVIISGAIYNSSGQRVYSHFETTGWSLFANVDADPEPEFIRSRNDNILRAFDLDGTEIWNVFTASRSAKPNAADTDGDGLAEIVIPTRDSLMFYESNGQLRWKFDETLLEPSGSTTASFYDINNDGIAEVLYQSTYSFRIFNSVNGNVIYEAPANSATAAEYPIIADLALDGFGEIVVTNDHGVQVYKNRHDNWKPARTVWNQHYFYSDNIDENLQSPQNAEAYWLTHNSVRQSITRKDKPLADLVVTDITLDESESLDISIFNRGTGSSKIDTFVDVYHGDPANGGTLIITAPVEILASNSSSNISVDASSIALEKDIYVVVDADNLVEECFDNNNFANGLLFDTSVTDPLGLSDSQKFVVNVKAKNAAPMITSLPKTSGTLGEYYSYQIEASDPNLGDTLTYSIVSGPEGATLNSQTGYLRYKMLASGTFDFVVKVEDLNGLEVSQPISLVVTGSSDGNVNPYFTSQPVIQATREQNYEYQATAEDPNGDTLTFELSSKPETMTISANGLITWDTSSVAVGSYIIRLNVNDGNGGQDQQNFVINVVDNNLDNENPTISSQPIFFAAPNATYSYTLVASDPEGQTLDYELLLSPDAMSISANGEISWNVASTDLGEHSIIVRVNDTAGGFATQSYVLNVAENQPPVITSAPILSGISEQNYIYNVFSTDPDLDDVTYRLDSAPDGMIVNTNSGVIQWVPTSSQVGVHTISIAAVDTLGAQDIQTYSLSIEAPILNTAPRITSQAPAFAAQGINYNYRVITEDDEGDLLTFSLTDAPSGMSIDGQGLITWLPDITQVGEHNVTVRVSDDSIYVEQSYVLTVYLEPLPLEVSVISTPEVANANQTVLIDIIAAGGIGSKQVIVTVNGIEQTVEAHRVTYVPTTPGRYDIVATVTDDTQTETVSDFFTVRNISDTSAPDVEIFSPGVNANVKSLTDVVATVSDDNLAEYFVALFPAGEELLIENATILSRGQQSVTEPSVVAQFDPSVMENGIYLLLVQAEDINGQVSASSVNVLVDGDLKVGNFSITFEDKNIPLAGIPIRVTRTYDSRQRSDDLDFGYGWSIGYQDVKVDESIEPTKGWQQFISSATFEIEDELININATCTASTNSKLVTVTLPDGEVEKFNVRSRPVSGGVVSISNPDCTLAGGRYMTLEFEAIDDTYSTLELNEQGIFYLTDLTNGNLALDLIETDAREVSLYKLTTRTGFVYELDQKFGISKITDPNGNTITYSDSGIVHSSGKAITFNRDTQGRITSITDSNGYAVNYEYSSSGNLKSVINEENQTTSFTYNREHGLLDIIDPLGRNIVKNIYDDSGRLIAQEDTDGNRTDFVHNLAGRQSVVTNRLGNVTTLYYDEEGNITSQVDALNGVTAFTYDANGNQLSKTDAIGRVSKATFSDKDDQLTQTDALDNVVTFTYNERGQELTVTDERNNVFTNSYDAVGNLLSISDPEENEVSNVIGVQGLPTLVTDALGNETRYTYDTEGNKLTETDALGNVMSFTYDDNNNVLTETRSRTLANNTVVQESMSYTYDKLNRVIAMTNALGQTSTVEFDVVGNQVASVDALGRRTEMDYDAYGRVIETRYHDGTSDAKTYDAEGNLLTETDRNGRVTSFEYDKLNRLIKTTYADTSFTQTEYDAVGQVIAQVDANGNRTEFEYDLAGRRIKTKDALGNEHQFSYDKSGNVLTETDALSRVTSYVYDKLDRKTQTIFANLSTMSDGYDALARRTSSTDQAGVATNYAYDALGRLLSVTDVAGNETSFTYDESGNKLTQTDAEGRTTAWTYDALGRVVTRTLPLGQVETTTYDLVGNMLTHTDFNGELKTYTYDSNNRVTLITYAKDSSTESFTYDNNGNRLTATNAEGTWIYTYDVMNRLASEAQPNGDKLEYSYDGQGNKTQLKVTYQNGDIRIENSTYDVLNRLNTVTDADGNVTTYDYDAVGNRIAVTHSNANVTSYVYDELNRLTQMQDKREDDSVFQQFDYTLHATGRRTKIEELSGRVSEYTYDSLYRLTDEVITDPVNGNYTASYTFDKVGNRVASTINGVSTVYTYDNNDRLTQEGGEHYAYDENGNTLSKTIDSDVTTYTYDARQRLVHAEITDGGVSKTLNYRYNVDGIRNQKVEDGAITNYLVDSNRDYAQVVAEIDSANVVSAEYVFGDDLLAQKRGAVLSSYHYDGLGSTRALTDSSGNISDEYFYDAFGVELARTGSTVNDYLFTGEQYDAGLGNYYLRARYYDQGVGRFTQQDVWMGINSDPVTLHKYMYANADPVNGIDPSGYYTLMGMSAANNNLGITTTMATTHVMRIAMPAANQAVYATGSAVTSKQIGLGILAGLAGGAKLLDLLTEKTEDDDNNEDLVLYHGTSARRAYNIVENGGFEVPFDRTVFFSDNSASALFWARTIASRRPPGETPPTRFGVIEFNIPDDLANVLGLKIPYPVGTCRGVGGRFAEAGGTEHCLIGSEAIGVFNTALRAKIIRAKVTKY